MTSHQDGFEQAGTIGRRSAAQETRAITHHVSRGRIRRMLSLIMGLACLVSAAEAQQTAVPEAAAPTPAADAPAPAPESPPMTESVEESVGVEADALVAESSRVALAQFTTAIEEREPVDQVSFIGTDVNKIYFYSDLREMTGTVVTHKWIYGGNVMAEVDFAVKGPRWRVWSSKALEPKYVGDWTVEVVTSDGEVLASETLTLSAVEG